MHCPKLASLASWIVAILSAFPLLAFGAAGTSDTPVRIDAMHLVRPSTGWVLSGGSHVYWTTNNGQSWNEITPALNRTQGIQSVFFMDASHGWVALDDGADSAKLPFSVASTKDGGKSWQYATLNFNVSGSLFAGAPATVTSIDFTDAEHGWIMYQAPTNTQFSDGLLARTEDGGAHWALALKSVPIAGQLSFGSSSMGVLYGRDPQSDDKQHNHAWHTTDGGSSWQKAALPLPAQCSRGNCLIESLGPAFFQSRQEVFLAATVRLPDEQSVASFLYKSVTAGSTWDIDSASLTQGKNELRPTAMFDGQAVYLLQRGGTLSLQAGMSETQLQLPTALGWPFTVTDASSSFVDSANGWLLGGGFGCAAGFHIPCIHPSEQASFAVLFSLSGGGLNPITPSTGTIIPNAAGAVRPPYLQRPVASRAEAEPYVGNAR